MVDGRSTPRDRSSTTRGLVQQYTPDGTIGRILLALVTGPISFFSFWFAFVGLIEPGLLSSIAGLFFGALTIGAGLLTLLLLWPIYLSAIGQIESPAVYSGEAEDDAREDEDPIAALKREYATGEISESEFEHRLETLVGVEAVEQARETSGRGASDVDGSSAEADGGSRAHRSSSEAGRESGVEEELEELE